MSAGHILLIIWAGAIPGIILTSACIASIFAANNKAKLERTRMGGRF